MAADEDVRGQEVVRVAKAARVDMEADQEVVQAAGRQVHDGALRAATSPTTIPSKKTASRYH